MAKTKKVKQLTGWEAIQKIQILSAMHDCYSAIHDLLFMMDFDNSADEKELSEALAAGEIKSADELAKFYYDKLWQCTREVQSLVLTLNKK